MIGTKVCKAIVMQKHVDGQTIFTVSPAASEPYFMPEARHGAPSAGGQAGFPIIEKIAGHRRRAAQHTAGAA
jgi:hypothetical protein